MNPAVDSSSGACATASRHAARTRTVLERVRDVDGEHLGPELVQTKLERGHDAEVASAAAERPVEVGVSVAARADDAAVCEDDLRRDEVVHRHPVPPALVGHAAAERKPGNAGLGHDAAGSRESERRGDAVDVPPGGAALDVDGLAGWVDPGIAHARQIDHDAVVDEGRARDVVPARGRTAAGRARRRSAPRLRRLPPPPERWRRVACRSSRSRRAARIRTRRAPR